MTDLLPTNLRHQLARYLLDGANADDLQEALIDATWLPRSTSRGPLQMIADDILAAFYERGDESIGEAEFRARLDSALDCLSQLPSAEVDSGVVAGLPGRRT